MSRRVILTEEEVRQVAALARLGLDDEEVRRLAPELAAVVQNAEHLDELLVDVGQDLPDAVTPGCPLRPDDAASGIGADALLDQAPDQADGHLRVPPPAGERDRGED